MHHTTTYNSFLASPSASSSSSPLTISFILLAASSLFIRPVVSLPSSLSTNYDHPLNRREVNYNSLTAVEDAVDFYSPISRGQEGSMLTVTPGPYAIGLGEPLNAIFSARSDPEVLTVEGFLLWATSVNFGVSCLGQGSGTGQLVSLGDGKINRTQGNGDGYNGVLRYNYGNPFIGTCRETFEGGNHFRWWIQNGSLANSGAYFLAVSAELPLTQNHLIMPNGYNRGRDEMISNATLPNGTTYGSHWFNTTVSWVEAGVLLNATSDRINHAAEVAVDGMPAQDGRVAVLTVKYLAGPRKFLHQNSAMPLDLLQKGKIGLLAAVLLLMIVT